MGPTNLTTRGHGDQGEDQKKWLSWASYHRHLNGWKEDAEGVMVATWIGFLRRQGYTPEELFAATDRLAKCREKTYKREDHLAALQSQIQEMRRDKMMAAQAMPACPMCRGNGVVSVPLLADIKEGNWTSRRTGGVWCSCRGNHPKGIGMGLDDYRYRNPGYERQLKDAQAADRVNADCEAVAKIRARYGLIDPADVAKVEPF